MSLNRSKSWLAQERPFWRVAAVLLGLLAALKGLRWPSDWVLTQAQVDYSQGLLKRGLTGAVLGPLHLLSQRPLRVVFFTQLVLLLLLLGLFVRQTRLSARFGSAALAALFASSYAVTFLFHLVGYTDIPNAALAVLLLLVRSPRLRFALALMVFPLALLIHENFLFLFAPVVLLGFYLDGLNAEPGRPAQRLPRPWLFAIVLALAAGAMTLATSLRAPLTQDQADLIEAAADARADFNVRSDFFQVLTFSLRDNLHTMQQFGWTRWFWWTWFAVSLFVLVPTLWLLLHFIGRLRAGRLKGGATTAAILFSIFAPLSLHLIALDCVRWNVWVVVNALLALGLVSRAAPVLPSLPAQTFSVAERNAIILVIAVSMASGWGLFDADRTNPYPFFPRAVAPWIDRHETSLPGLRIPE